MSKGNNNNERPSRLDQEFSANVYNARLEDEFVAQAAPRFQNERQAQARPRLENEYMSQAAPRFQNERQAQARPRLQNEYMSQAAPRFRIEQRSQARRPDQSQAQAPRLLEELQSQASAITNLGPQYQQQLLNLDEPPADLFDNDSDLDEQMDQIVEYNNNMELDLLGLENSLTNAEMQEQAVATEKVEWTDWADEGDIFEQRCLKEESFPQLTFHKTVHGCLPLNWMSVIMESKKISRNSSKFRRVIFQDEVAITDAVLESWYRHLQGEFDPLLIESVNLQGCQFVTDWGIHWLAMLLKGKRGQTKVKLDGCRGVTEKGLLELCNAGPVVRVSCNNTAIACLPEIINKLQPKHRVARKSFPLLQQASPEKTVFGPYSKVLIHQNRLCSTSLLDLMRNTQVTSDTSVAMVTDLEINPRERHLQEHRKKPLLLNVLQMSQNDSCFGLVTSEEPNQVVIPFEDGKDTDDVAAVVTEVMKHNISKEKPCISSCFEEKKVTMPPHLWSIQSVQEFLVDFYTGIVELSPYPDMSPCRLMFGEQMGKYYFNKLELEVLECMGTVESTECCVAIQLMDLGGSNTRTMGEMQIQTGDQIVLEYLPSEEIVLKQNNTMVGETVSGFQNAIPVIVVSKTNFKMKLKVKNLNCLEVGDPPQCFVKANFNNQDYLFDHSTGIVRCDNSAKNMFAFRGVRGLFKAVQPLSESNNSVAIKVLDMGRKGEMSFGLTYLTQRAKQAMTNPWAFSDSLYFDIGKKRVTHHSTSVTNNIEDNIPELDSDDTLRIQVDGLKNDYVEAGETVTVRFYHNNVQFCEKPWEAEYAGRIYPALSINNTDEYLQILNFKDPKPLHSRMADAMNDSVLICGQSKCRLAGSMIEAGPNCRDQAEYKEYFMAANSLSLYKSFYEVAVRHVEEHSVFSLGLVHKNHLKSKSPGNSQGTVGWIFDNKGNYVHVSQQKVRSRSETNLKSAISAKSAFLGCGFKTENLVWDEYGLPIPYQDIPVYFTNNGRKVHETTFRYLGGGLYPYIQMGQAGIKIQINQLLDETFSSVHMQERDVPVGPGTQYVLAAVSSEGRTKDWSTKVKSLEASVKENLEKHAKNVKVQKQKILNRTQVSFQNHQEVSILSRTEHNIELLLMDWDKRTSFVTVDASDSQRGVSELVNILGRNTEYSALHQPHMYYYNENVHTLLDTICKLSTEKICTIQQIMQQLYGEQKGSQAELVHTCLRRLHHWGKVLLVPAEDPAFVITDPGWFVRILSMLPVEAGSGTQGFLEFVSKDTPLWTPKELLTVSTQKLSKEKVIMLLQVLVESGLLMRLKPHRNDKNDPRYFLTQPSALGGLPSTSALQKYYSPSRTEENDKFVHVSKVYKLTLEPLSSHVWYSVVAAVTEFCEAKLLWSEGIVWHQGPVECVLLAQNTENRCSSLIFEAKTYSIDVDSTSIAPRSKSLLYDVFRTFTDIVDAILIQNSVVADSVLKNVQENDAVVCSVHQWQRPQGENGVSVCTLCHNCCDEGVRCDYNGLLHDKPLTCLCETQRNCCYCCGVCQRCANRLWTYRSRLHPGSLNASEQSPRQDTSGVSVSNIEVTKMSSYPMDTAVCNEFYIRVPDRSATAAASSSWGLISEDGDEFFVCVSSRILLDCPDVVYTYPVNNSNLSFFTSAPGYKDESHAVYKVKLCDQKMPPIDEDLAPPNKYNVSAMAGVCVFDETGIVECIDNNWTDTKVTGYIVSKLPLSPKCFYYEAEIMAMGTEEGFAGIGLIPLDHEDKYKRMKYGFQASVSSTLFGELEEQNKEETGVLSAVKVGDKLGVGIIHNKQEEPNQVFFTLNGIRQKMKVMSSKELSGHVVVKGEGWRVRLTTRGVWRHYTDDLHEAVDALLEQEKLTQDWGRHGVVDISPQSLLKFQAARKIPGQEDEIHAQIVLKANPDKQHHVLFKVDISNFKRYVVKPEKGMIAPGQTAVVNVTGKCSEIADVTLDKFRVEWKVDVSGLSVKNYGTEYTGFGTKRHEDGPFSIFDNKWTVAWNDSENSRSKKHAVLFCKLVAGTHEQAGVVWIDEFVKNIYNKKKQSNIIPQPLPKVEDISPDTPQYVLEVYKNEELRSRSWVPRKKYYIAKIQESKSTEFSIKEEQDTSLGVFVPRLPTNQQCGIVPGMKVYKAFTPELFARGMSVLVNERKSILRKEIQSKANLEKQVLGKKQKVQSVNFKENVEVIDKSNRPIPKDEQIAEEFDLHVLYGPCTVKQVLGGGKLLLQWDLGDLTPENVSEDEDKAWRLFVCDPSDLHSQFWTEYLNWFHSERKLTRTSLHKTISVWESETDYSYSWNMTSGTNIKTDRHQLIRSEANQFDAVRGDRGFSTGVHVFHIDVRTDSKTGLKPFQFGICTGEADLTSKDDKAVLGVDGNSWMYNVTSAESVHRDIAFRVVDAGLNLLQYTAQQGDITKVKELLSLGADIDAVTPDGLTPLHLACYGHHLELCELLLDRGADINKTTKTGLTALHLSCYEHQIDLLELILRRGADINRRTKRGNTGLHIACLGGFVDLLEMLVEYGADLNFQTVNGGYTALHIAAQENYAEIVKILEKNGADKDIKTHDGHTALTEALQRNHHEVIRLLAGNEDISRIKVPTAQTSAKEDIADEKEATKPQKARSITLEMKLNLLNPKWPYVTLRFPQINNIMCTPFEGPSLAQALFEGEDLYPCLGISPCESKVRCSIKLVYSGQTDMEDIPEDIQTWEKIGIFEPTVPASYVLVPGPDLFPAEKQHLKMLSDRVPADRNVRNELLKALCVFLGNCTNKGSLTSDAFDSGELHNLSLMSMIEHMDFIPPSVFVPLPKVLDLDTLRFPSLKTALDIKNLCLHFLCKPTDTGFEELHEQSYMMHFVDRPAEKILQGLPEDLFFGVCANAWAYISINKLLLPKYDNLVELSVTKMRSRTQIEHLMQNYIRLLSSVSMANFKNRNYTFGEGLGMTMKAAEGRFKEDFNLILKYLPDSAKQKLSPKDADQKKQEPWMCNSHLYDTVTSQGSLGTEYIEDVHCSSEIVQNGVLNLQPYEPYNELITAIRLTTNMHQLEQIPTHFQDMFPNLKILMMDQANSLKKLPASIGKLKKLWQLSFTTEEDIMTEELPNDIGDCRDLEVLRLPRALITSLPDSITKNKRLKVLVMDSNSITHLPHRMGDLRKLETVMLNSNPIASLPDNMKNLKNLTALHLSGIPLMPIKVLYREKEPYEQWFQNQEKDIVKILTLNRVQELYSTCKTLDDGMSVTDLYKVNAHLFYEVPRLGLDFVSGDEDGGIPEPIFQLENLEILDLSNQAIRFVPPQVSQLIKLRKLILSKNMLLESLPGSLGSMKKLRTIGLRHCPSIKTPPAEIISRGVQAIAAYMRRLSGGTTENWRTKLMLVGLGGAGKTSLLRALMSPNHKTLGTSASELTDGIDIKPWTVKDKQGRQITYSTWDFAGQDVYYNTHQFFLSGRAVYMLLWACRLGFEHAGLDFWLSSIQCHAPKAPIFIVGTHCDQVSKAQIPKEMLMKKYPQIKGFHFVSSIQGTGILNLEKQLIEVTKLESYMGEAVPTVYLSLENKILQMRKEKNVIPWSDVQQLAVECGIFNVDDIKRAVTFLHDLGTVQYFDNEFLRDYVVINPQWIVDVMTCVVSVKNSPIQDGKFYHSTMNKVWKDYPVELHDWLLRLTEEFDLTFPIPSEPINLVPCLLPQTEPKFDWPEVREGERETMMLYRFTYLPAGLFNRTQVRLFQFSDEKVIWKRGSLLRKNDHLALIKQLSDKEMLVRVQGPRPENVLFLIHEVIESLVVESFSGVRYDFLIPCPDCVKKSGSNLPEKALFESSLILEAVEWNTPFLQCRMHFHTVSMSVLQAAIPSEQDNEIDVHLSQSMRALEDLRSSSSHDVFVHYCDEDLPQNDTKAIHPSTVVKDLQKAGFSCWYRDNLSKVDIQEVTLGLQNSKMMVLFMSNNYERQRQCSDLFKYAKHTLNKPYQVVAFGEDMNWTKTNMGGMEIGSHHVFVNMRQKDRYPTKIEELKNHVKNKLDSLKQTSSYPRCFISYAWSNSHQAVKLGSKHVPGALGWEKGDPRYIKEQLETQGVSCWLDTEQTGKAGLFEDISKGIRHADVMIAFVSTEYTKSKNCMMELRFAECALEKPIVAVSVGTSDDWRFSEVLMLLNRTKTPVIHMQTPNEEGLERIISMVKEHIANSLGKSEEIKTSTVKEPVRYTEVSFQEEYELAQRRLLRHVSRLAAMMDTTPYPRLFILDLKEKPDRYERPMSARSVGQDTAEQKHLIKKRDSKITTKIEDYDSSWTESSYVVKLFCEYDGGWHSVGEDLDLADDMHASEREEMVREWAEYLGRVYSLLKHSTVPLNMLNMEQGTHLQNFINHCMSESDGNFSDAYIKMRDKIISSDKEKLMGKLDRCHLPTGQIRWLCPEHQKGHRITVLSSDVDMGTAYGEGHLVTDDDVKVKEKIEELSHLAEPYIKKRKSQKPRRFTSNQRGQTKATAELDVKSAELQDSETADAGTSKPSTPSDTSEDTGSNQGKTKPTPKPRLSRLGTVDRPVSASTKTKMKVGAMAVQSGEGGQAKSTSKACQIL